MQVLFAEAPLDADIFLSYLHHNYPPFTDEIDECSGIVDALSAADVVMSAKDEGDEVRRSRSRSCPSRSVFATEPVVLQVADQR
mgnify:CR=1 FL=1